jgi:lactate dehydrogenase-like 2-hydroxyacid dehydrogenase
MPPRVLVTRADLPGTGLNRLAASSELVLWSGASPPTAADLRTLAPWVDGVLAVGGDAIDAGFLESAGPSLQVVALASMGYDKVDQVAAAAHGVIVTHTPNVLAETTADLAFALILMARRRLGEASRSLLEGQWSGFAMDGYLGLDVHGASLGILGYGQIGRAVARRGHGFGMRVRHYSRSGRSDDISEAVDLATLLAGSDVVSIHVPLTPDTRHLIGAAELAAMKPTATLVNTARGPIVDEQALVEALRAGRLHSAGLDVFEQEPLGDTLDDLKDVPGLVMLPHIGSATMATRAAMVDLAVDNLLAVLGGGVALTPIPAES